MLIALPIAAYQLGYGWWGVVIGILVAIPLAGLLLTLFCAILLNLDRSKRKP